MTAAMSAISYISPVQRAQDRLEEKLRRFKTMTTRTRIMTVDDYIGIMKFWDEEVVPANDAVRAALVDMHNVS